MNSSDGDDEKSHVASRLGAVLLVLAFPVAIWFLIGDMSTSPLPPSQSDYLVRPLPIAGWVESTAGIAAIIVVVASGVLLYRERKRGSVSHRVWIAVALLIPAGLIISFAGRIITAGVIGANIGGAMMFAVALPIAGILIIAAVVFLIVSLFRERSNR